MTVDRLAKILEAVIKGGPWALLVIIVLAWLAGDYGFLESQSKKGVDLLQRHEQTMAEQQKSLYQIIDVLKEQKKIQSQSALLACLRGAKTDVEREDCVRRFPL